MITIFLRTRKQTVDSATSETAVIEVFKTVNGNPSLARGIEYFLKSVVSKTDAADGKWEKDTIRWGCRIATKVLEQIAMSDTVLE